MANKKFQKGVSLYIAIMVMAIILAVVLGLTGIIVGQIRMVSGIKDSVIAIYAADTGVERVQTDFYNDISPSVSPSPLPAYYPSDHETNGTTYPVSGAKYWAQVVCPTTPLVPDLCPQDVLRDPNCGGQFICIRSVGIYGSSERAIEVKF